MTETAETHAGSRAYLPTPEEIAKACLEIQAGWSAAERERRACGGFRREEWRLPGELSDGVKIQADS